MVRHKQPVIIGLSREASLFGLEGFGLGLCVRIPLLGYLIIYFLPILQILVLF